MTVEVNTHKLGLTAPIHTPAIPPRKSTVGDKRVGTKHVKGLQGSQASVRVEKGIRPKRRNHETRQEENVQKKKTKTTNANVHQALAIRAASQEFLSISCLQSF